ncbi:MAG: branched-chain amino acid transaminase [Shinella sp.]|uniref:branched-chain amino acid transaminase n=1 Tax=Shinella sp. TaxID=1870904 RepID=UPI003C7193DB
MLANPNFAWMDGEIVEWKNATVHVSTDLVLRGANVFEGMRGYWNSEKKEMFIFRNAEHLKRLRQSAKIMRMSIPYDDEQLTDAFLQLIRKNGFEEGVHFRPVVYFDQGEPNYYKPEEIRTGMFILAFARPHSKAVFNGVESCTSTWRRNSDLSMPSRVKAGANYHNSRLAHVEARINGFSSPIMLNERGKVSEGPASCFMMVRDGVVITPPVTGDILESITRATLIQLFREELGIEVVEREVDRSELYIADEGFFCGSGAEVTPMISLDRYPLGTGEVGPITKKIQKLYFDVAEGKVEKYRDWLLPVYGRG